MYRTVCFTGHRAIPREEREALTEKVFDTVEKLILDGATDFYCGGAIGFDTLAAEVVIALRIKYEHIKLHIISPCVNQEKMWTAENKKKYYEINGVADEVKCLSDKYYNGCMHIRNRYMVDNTDVCIAYITKETGGTASTVRHAKNKGKPVIIVR